ncbi:MAG: nuclear transport factor 2 family protein [Gammaproteobacteria bacterium]
MADTAELIAQLTRRIQALEDERAVRDVITRYCFAVDSDDPDACESLYWGDCVVSIDDKVFYRGSQVRDIVTGPGHQSILPKCSHVMAPFMVEVDGPRATATGYANVVVRNEDNATSRIWRQSYNRFELEKRDGTWKIARRISYAVGSAEAQAVLKKAL